MDKFDYIGVGNSTNKKDAQSNAAKDFVSYLVRQGHVAASDVPGDLVGVGSDAPDTSGPSAEGGSV